MPESPETPWRRSEPAEWDEAPQDIPAETERPADERIGELQAEIDALRRENADLRLADTERRRDGEALREEKERVGAILSALDTGQSLVEPDMTIVWVNQKAREFFPEYEPIGGKCYRLFEGMSEPCEVCAARQTLETGEVTRIEKYVPYRGRWFGIVAQPIKDASGKVVRVLESFTDITERKQAEEALRESEAKYRTLVETALDIVLVHDGERILYINPTGVNLLGASCPDEILGRNFLEIVHPDSRDRVQKNVAMDLRGDASPATQLQLLRLDGTALWVEGKGVMTCIGGKPAVQVIIRDITERRRAEEALWHQAEMFQRLVDTIPAMIAIFDPKLQQFRFNRALREILGWTEEDAAGGDFMAMVYPDPEYRAEVAGFMQSLEPGWRDLKTTAKDGSIVESSWANISISDDTWIGIGIDIRERKRAEEAVQKSRAKLEAALASMTDAVFISDTEGRFVEFNDAFVTFHRARDRDECYRMLADYPNHIDVYSADGTQVPPDMWALPRALRGEKVTNTVQVLRRKDTGESWVGSFSFAPIRDKDGGIVGSVVVGRDITEQKLAEEALTHHTEELTRLHSDLKVANREANLYLDILTHDIGNTENVSNLYADLLIESLDGEAAGWAKNLQRSIQKSIEILGTVSTIRRIHRTTTELKPMDLDAAVLGVVEEYPTGTLLYCGTDYQVQADDLLSVVVNNLIGNAVKHGGPGVEIAVRVEEKDGMVRVSVEDTGPGIPDDEKQAIFHRYEQKKRGVGEGLGLYLVQILVERYGGRVWADDRVPGRPEEGAAFRFTLQKA